MTFNLVDEPVVPVIRSGVPVTLSLRDVFESVDDITMLAMDNPLEESAVMRLLIAITHSALRKPTLNDPDVPSRFPAAKVVKYLEKHHDRFDLYGEKPFFQRTWLADVKARDADPGTLMRPVTGPGESKVFYNRPTGSIGSAEAARFLIAAALWGNGGKCAGGSSANGLLAGKFLVIPMGSNLGETILLNLYPAPILGAPFWEHEESDLPDGWLSRLAWPMRSYLLNPNDDFSRCDSIRFGVGTKGAEMDVIDEHGGLKSVGKKGEWYQVKTSKNPLWLDAEAFYNIDSGHSKSQMVENAVEVGSVSRIMVFGYDNDANSDGSRVSRVVLPYNRTLLRDNAAAQRLVKNTAAMVEMRNGELEKALQIASGSHSPVKCPEFFMDAQIAYNRLLRAVMAHAGDPVAQEDDRAEFVKALRAAQFGWFERKSTGLRVEGRTSDGDTGYAAGRKHLKSKLALRVKKGEEK